MKICTFLVFFLFTQTAFGYDPRYYLNPFYVPYGQRAADLSDKSEYLHRKWELDEQINARNKRLQGMRRQKNEEYNRTHSPKYSFTFEGKTYSTFDAFLASEAGQRIRFEQEMKTLDEKYTKEANEVRYKKGIQDLHEWRSARYPDVYRLADDRNRELAQKAMGDGWWARQESPQFYEPTSPSYKIVERIAQKYKITQRQAWEEHSEEVLAEFQKIIPNASKRTVLPLKPIR